MKVRAMIALAALLILAALAMRLRDNAAQSPKVLSDESRRIELTVSAAASLREVLFDIARDYEIVQPRVRVRFNFAGSGTLQRQVEEGAPVDVFIAAAAKNMDALAAQNLIDASTRRVFARNALVLVAPRDATITVRDFRDLANPAVRRVAIGAPDSVPAGRYALQLLQRLDIHRAVWPKAVQTKDVRGALAQAELGNVDAAIVYRTDAALSSRVKIVAVAPPQAHEPIVYPMAVLREAPQRAAAMEFQKYLSGAAARAALRRYHFAMP